MNIKNLDGGEMYEMVDEEEHGSCTGCVFDNKPGESYCLHCEQLMHDCVQNDKIFKLKETTMKSSAMIIKECAVELMDSRLLNECLTDRTYTSSDVEDEVAEALGLIPDEAIEELITDNLEISDFQKEKFADKKLNDRVGNYIDVIRFGGSQADDDITDDISSLAKLLIEDNLIDILIDESTDDLTNYYLHDFFNIVEQNFPSDTVDFVRSAINEVSDERVDTFIKIKIVGEIEEFVNKM